MIQNLFIIKDGIPLLNQNFGMCHSLGTNVNLIAGFISALDSFSKEIGKNSIELVKYGDVNLFFLKRSGLLFLIVADSDDDQEYIQSKIKRISALFLDRYRIELHNFNGILNVFQDFKTLLIDLNIAQKNCGGHPECEGCENSTEPSKMMELFKVLGFKG